MRDGKKQSNDMFYFIGAIVMKGQSITIKEITDPNRIGVEMKTSHWCCDPGRKLSHCNKSKLEYWYRKQKPGRTEIFISNVHQFCCFVLFLSFYCNHDCSGMACILIENVLNMMVKYVSMIFQYTPKQLILLGIDDGLNFFFFNFVILWLLRVKIFKLKLITRK